LPLLFESPSYFAVYYLHITKLQTSGFNIVNAYTSPIFMFKNTVTCLYGPGFESRHRQETFLFSQPGFLCGVKSTWAWAGAWPFTST